MLIVSQACATVRVHSKADETLELEGPPRKSHGYLQMLCDSSNTECLR